MLFFTVELFDFNSASILHRRKVGLASYRFRLFDALFLSFLQTNDTFNVGQEYKRYIFVPKTGVVKPKGIFSAK